jgi:hypothetical protein
MLNVEILFFIYKGIVEMISKIESLTYHKPTLADDFKVTARNKKTKCYIWSSPDRTQRLNAPTKRGPVPAFWVGAGMEQVVWKAPLHTRASHL